MPHHLDRAIEELKQQVLLLGGLAEERLRLAVRAFLDRDGALAGRVIEGDEELDGREVDIEEECLKLLALYHPVAGDLRFVIAMLKLNNDLERIGDLAVNIAERAREIEPLPAIPFTLDFEEWGGKTLAILKKALDALVNRNVVLAHEVRREDDEIDRIKAQAQALFRDLSGSEPGPRLETRIAEMSVAHQLERAADHATNIAEDVIYLVEGRIVRHRHEPA